MAPPMFQEQASQILGGVPFGVAPTGSVATNGALTLGTALNQIYTGGIYLFLPSGAAFAGSAAGFYWCVMTSTTVGTIFNNVLGNGIPSVPATATPIVAAGPGAYTGSTSAQTVTIPLNPNVLGAAGYARILAMFGTNNTANNKTTTIAVGGTNVFTLTQASQVGVTALTHVFNQASQAVQTVSVNAANPFANGTLQFATVSFASPPGVVPPNMTVVLTLATATDFVICQGLFAEFFYG